MKTIRFQCVKDIKKLDEKERISLKDPSNRRSYRFVSQLLKTIADSRYSPSFLVVIGDSIMDTARYLAQEYR